MPAPSVNADQVADILGAYTGSDGFHIGLIGTAPTSFKRLPETLSGWVFRFRKLNPEGVDPEWNAPATESCDTVSIEIENDPDHVLLWILDAGNLTARAIADLAKTLVAEHHELFPPTFDCCYHCGESKPDVRLVQDLASAVLICDACLARFNSETAADAKALNPVEPTALLMLPVAVATGAFGWFAPWLLMERLTALTGDGMIVLPRIVMLALVIGAGALIGWPTGRLLKRSGLLRNAISRVVATVLFAAAVVSLGEYLFSLWIVHLVVGGIPSLNTWARIVPLLAESSWDVLALRAVLLVTLACFTFSFAQPTRTQRRG